MDSNPCFQMYLDVLTDTRKYSSVTVRRFTPESLLCWTNVLACYCAAFVSGRLGYRHVSWRPVSCDIFVILFGQNHCIHVNIKFEGWVFFLFFFWKNRKKRKENFWELRCPVAQTQEWTGDGIMCMNWPPHTKPTGNTLPICPNGLRLCC